MVALTKDRNSKSRPRDARAEPMAATVKIDPGAIVMRNAAGFATKGATATGAFGIGVALETVDNTGAAGAATVVCVAGISAFANPAAGDAIVQADVGKVCVIVDDQTVAKTNGGNTRSPAGIVDGMACRFGGGNVWVRFDEAPMRIG